MYKIFLCWKQIALHLVESSDSTSKIHMSFFSSNPFNFLPNNTILDQSKLKQLEDNKINATEIVWKVENAGY